jgi:hypothetical protein
VLLKILPVINLCYFFDRLASKVQGARLVDHFYDKSNWCIILEKL